MKRHARTSTPLLVIASTLLLAACTDSHFPTAELPLSLDATSSGPDRYIVRLAAGVAGSEATRVAARFGLRTEHAYGHALVGFAATMPEALAERLRADPRVASVSLDREVHAFGSPQGRARPGGGRGGGGRQKLPTGVDRIDADLNPTEGGHEVVVYVLDTGIDLDHPDLQANIVGGMDFTGENGTGDDNNTDRTLRGHGTHVAGVLAALDNGQHVVGVGSGLGLYAVKVLRGDGSGSFSDLIAGIDFVTRELVEGRVTRAVVNLSLGTAPCPDCTENSPDPTIRALQDAIQTSVEAGAVYVVSAGNSSTDASQVVPAAFGGGGAVSTVMTVSALDDQDGTPSGDAFATFSNFGPDIDLIAPGVDILSTSNNGRTSRLSGTSFSAPHVAGVAALYLSVAGLPSAHDVDGDGVVSAADVVAQALFDSAEPAPTGGWPGDPDGIPEPLVDGNATIVGGTGQ